MVRANFATIIAHGAAKGAAHGSPTQAEADAAIERIKPTQSLEEAGGDADFVMETIAESKEAKTQLYSELDAICPERAVFASNTSSLNVFEFIPARRLPRSVCAHFFTPAHIIPLVEVVPGPETTVDTLDLTAALMQACGKSPVRMKRFGPGFIVNRIQRAIGETAMDMIQEGLVEPEEIDTAIKASLGIRLPIVDSFVEERVEKGYLGAKTSRGIYDYQGRSEVEILRKRDELYLQMLDYLREIGAFEPV